MKFSKTIMMSGFWFVVLTFTWLIYNNGSMFTFTTVHELQVTEDLCTVDLIEKIQSADYDVAPFNKSKVAPKYRLAVCQIEKVMTTVMDAVFCYLTNTTEFVSNNRTISTETFAKRFCSEQNELLGYNALLSAFGSTRVQFAIIRHPVHRFLSGFVDKCIGERQSEETRCFNCSNMNCFVEKLHALMIRTVNESLTDYNYEVAHFAPQTWYCNFKDHYYDYIILRHEEESNIVLAQKLNAIFKQANIRDLWRRSILEELLGGSMHHKTSGTKARIEAEQVLMSNKTLIALLSHIYYYDFIVLKYPLPVLF